MKTALLTCIGLCIGLFAPLPVSLGLAVLIGAMILIGNRDVGV